ncbi:hypothetical protein FB45DRAFT_1112023 [Roridomyces roridus]|uniref:Uncharacterized protein n=1 Tax=Roridomyces roridus TaxID=1738132 RepID=A0AAD7B8C5_9AGAR|nr:hypothetical protein FB45DRAFT_1112023 [Roridomyces roridus]
MLKAAPGDILCTLCNRYWKKKGFPGHKKACEKKTAEERGDTQFVAKQLETRQRLASRELAAAGIPVHQAQASSSLAPHMAETGLDIIMGADFDNDIPEVPHLEECHSPPESDQSPPPPEEIKRVFHPHSERGTVFLSYREYVMSTIAQPLPPVDPEPWRPFRTRLDFEVAEFCETNMLTKTATGALISIIRRAMHNPEEFTLSGQRELDELWDLASHKCTEGSCFFSPFERGTVTVRFKQEDTTFDTYTRPLWDWARSLVQDPRLASCFVWDAEKVYKFNGDTADAFWAAQSSLPKDPAAKPVCFVVYADKSKLSTFGTQKAYAVVARIANMPDEIRNTTRFGGGQVVGHQPIVPDDPEEHNKPRFANFKNIVWHAAFYKLLESLVEPAKVGDWTQCGDDILRWLWPIILILAADYEEACVMALIRGLQCLYPCPICFVPWNEQDDLSQEHPKRSATETQEILKEARAKRTVAEKEEILKDHGMRDVENVFWNIKGADPHSALSYDPLHADGGGLWGDHQFTQIKARVTELGRAAIVKIDTQMAAFPRWRGFGHFENIMNTSFNDGSKHDDISKMMLFVAHNVLVDDAGLLLLQVLRSYLEYHMLLELEVHTTETIAEGKREVLEFDSIVKDYIDACEGTVYAEKSWKFPKFHARQHAFTDIENKGACRNFGTKPSEAMHAQDRNTYHRLTNFKNVTAQLVKHDHRRAVATFVREQIEALDEDPDEASEETEPSILSNINIGSKTKPVAFSVLEEQMVPDAAFTRFRVRFGDFLSDFLPTFGYNLPNGRRIHFNGLDTITPFRFLKVHYESLGTWKSTSDYLRCNPDFHGQARFDCVLVQTADRPIFAQLVYMFSCTVEDKSHPFALIQPMDAPVGRVSRKDRLLRFRRVRAKPRVNSEFISAHSIIRGAVLVPDFDNFGEFIVFDLVDTDMSRRMKQIDQL